MINILLVDDHHLVRAGVRSLLEANINPIFSVVAESDSGEQAIDLAKQIPCDIAIIDIEMPGISAEELIKQLQIISPNTRCIILTGCDEESLTSRLLSLGALAYVTKSCESEHLIQAILKAMNNERYLSPIIAKKLAFKVLQKNQNSSINESPFQDLSSRELQCFQLIAQGKSIKEIAKILDISSKTINTYRYRIFHKLAVDNEVDLIKLAAKHNILESTC